MAKDEKTGLWIPDSYKRKEDKPVEDNKSVNSTLLDSGQDETKILIRESHQATASKALAWVYAMSVEDQIAFHNSLKQRVLAEAHLAMNTSGLPAIGELLSIMIFDQHILQAKKRPKVYPYIAHAILGFEGTQVASNRIVYKYRIHLYARGEDDMKQAVATLNRLKVERKDESLRSFYSVVNMPYPDEQLGVKPKDDKQH